jgi:Family of unknown function (DUF5317)
MLSLLTIALGAGVAGALRHGSLEALAQTKFRFAWLLGAGLALQIGFDLYEPEWLTDRLKLAVVLWSNVLVITFIALNRGLPGMTAMAVGLFLNVVVITANGAMPVSPAAVEAAGLSEAPTELSLKHEVLGPDTALPWLADIIPLPNLKEVLSAGDLVLMAGIAALVYERMTAGTGVSRRRPAASG